MTEIRVIRGDITKSEVDVIVNAANSGLRGGGGVDGAIHCAGGPAIMTQCTKIIKQIGHLPPGKSVITNAGKMPAKHVIHTVGPIYKTGMEEEMQQLLGECYESALRLASEYNLKTIAFPNISTGVYGFPKIAAAKTALQRVREVLNTDIEMQQILFVCFDEENYSIYSRLLK